MIKDAARKRGRFGQRRESTHHPRLLFACSPRQRHRKGRIVVYDDGHEKEGTPNEVRLGLRRVFVASARPPVRKGLVVTANQRHHERMCCFSRAVSKVGGTQIFARPLGDGQRQALVYSMTLSFAEELAMILPLPIDRPDDNAVDFISLSGYRTFFADLEKCFPPPKVASGALAAAGRRAPQPQPLTVHEVGDYIASFVPCARDFARLDARFRLPMSLAKVHHEYADWGFAVFQLRPHARDSQPQTVQPMAFTFRSRRPNAIFFPTLHIHDGKSLAELASFDHVLTLQTRNALLQETLRWRRSEHPVGRHVKTSRTGEITEPEDCAHRTQLLGELPNEDTWIEPPVCSGVEKLTGKGVHFAFAIDASAAYRPARDQRSRRWRAVARSRIDALHDGMLAGLSALTSEKASAWSLATPKPPTLWERVRGDEIPQLWLSSHRAFMFGPNGPEVVAPGSLGPFQIDIAAETDQVPRQTVRLIFARVPSETLIAEIELALANLLDRSVAHLCAPT